MSNALIVQYDVFACESRVTACTEDKKKDLYVASNIPELIEELEKISNELNIYDVKVSAPHAFIEEMSRAAQRKYANSKLQIGSI